MLQPLGAVLLIRSNMPDSALFAPLPFNHATKPSVLATAQSKPWQGTAHKAILHESRHSGAILTLW